jgi:organic radical activating enzyme
MIEPDTFAFHVTYTCPLACAHCCFGSSPELKDSLDPSFILGTIDEIPDFIKLVAFTGGEPFLHGNNLVKYVARAVSRGFVTRIVTSAYFGKTPAIARKKLAPLVDAGLKELSISWDDFHEEFVAFSCVKNVVHAALAANLRVAINIVQTGASRWNKEQVHRQLEVSDPSRVTVMESPINITGRAAEKLTEQPLRQVGYVGPCSFVLTGPTMSARGNLMPCCGVIPNTERLTIAKAPKPHEIPQLIQSSLANPLFLWLHLRGPYAIMEWISENYGIAIPPREEVGGICEACKLLFETPALDDKLDEVLQERAAMLEGELMLLESLFKLQQYDTTYLWADKSRITNRHGELSELEVG